MPTVSGFVFQDYNANGVFDTTTQLTNLGGTNPGNAGQIGTISTAVDVGVAGVTVTVYNAAGAQVAQTTTAAGGAWSTNATTAGQQYRVEFTGLPAGYVAGPHGGANGNATTTQFVTDGAGSANLGVVRAIDYYQDNPLIITSEYRYGTAVGNTTPAIISFPYASGSVQQLDSTQSNVQTPAEHAIAIPASVVGTTWGLGYNRTQKEGYAAAFVKRHSGLAPVANPTGAIFNFDLPATDTPNSVTTANVWINLQGLSATDISTNTAIPSIDTTGGFGAYFTARAAAGYDYDRDGDNTGWNAVGKSGFGGLDVSADGSTVYVMNLADNRLYIISVNPDGTANTSNIRAISVPTPAGVAASDVRAWAVQVQNGLVYVGLVDSAESTPAVRANLRGYVYAFNPATNTFGASLVNDTTGNGVGFDLSYNRGLSFGGSDNYNPWSPTYDRVLAANPAAPNPAIDAGFASQYPQPMLSGLAFDTQGNLTISIRDRNGDQTGRGTQSNGPVAGPSLNGDPAGRVEGVASGELLKAFVNGGAFSLEQNGANPNPPGQTGTGVGSNLGPAGGEYYSQDDYGNGGAGGGHGGTSLGGVAQLPGYNSILNTHFDPVYLGSLRTGGVRWFSSTSGTLEKSYQIYSRDEGAISPSDPNGTFGKANGLGDLVAIQATDPPVEIGNRVWLDTDRDGVQDPGENGISGVTIELRSQAGVLLATAVTDANGNYYFSNGIGTNTASAKYGIATLVNGGQYQITIPNVSGTQQTPLTGLTLTTANATHTGNGTTNDANGNLRNSDFTASGTSALAVVNLTANPVGNSNHNIDAGFVTGVSLGNLVWEDTDNDGLFDNGEVGIPNVTVNLYNGTGTLLFTQLTNNVGNYLFTGLVPGDYIVEVVGPAGYRSSTGSGADLINGTFETTLAAGNSVVNNQDHGKATAGSVPTGFTIRANTVTLGGVDNLVQDFGLVRSYSLGNRVWLDKNNSGTIDGGDGGTPGVDGATVRLYRPTDFDASGNLNAGAAAFRTTATAGGGYYRFDDLLGASATNTVQGSYVVVVDTTVGSLVGTRSSTGTNGSASGPFEPAPTAIAAPTVTDSDDSGTTITGGLVRSGVAILGPGANLPANEGDLVAGANPQGTLDKQANLTVDFGFYQPLAIGNFVFEDANNNGVLDTGEQGIDGVGVSLTDGAGTVIASTTTAGGGGYLFSNLQPGQYTIIVTTPTGFTTSTGLNGSASGPFEPAPQTNVDNSDHGTILSLNTSGRFVTSTVTLTDIGGNPDTVVTAKDANLRQDFGFFRPLAIGDFIFEDKNNDGLFNGTDAAVPGVLVQLLDAGGNVLGAQTTGADGLYRFNNLAAGNYTVRITPPAGFISSTGANGKATGPYEPATGITANNADHGTTAGGFISTTVTLLPTGNPDEGGTANLAQDFGLFRPVLLGNLVWRDANNNGSFDPLAGETGIAGVAVDLLDSTGAVLASTTTDANGLYQFPVAPGQYRVRITPPAGLASSTGNGVGNTSPTGPFEPSTGQTADSVDHGTTAGTFVQTELITIADPGTAGNPDSAGFANLRQDFGLYSPISLSLGNLVFEDANNNGTLDAGEVGIGGATVILSDAGGNQIGFTTTDGAGAYRFDNLPPGTYTVQVVAPAGYRNSDGVFTADSTDHGVIDPTTPNAASTTVTLTDPAVAPNPDESGKANLRQDFGFYQPQAIGNLVFVDTNNNGVLDTGETGLAGVSVQLLQNGNVLANTTTDANGNYLFSNLTSGAYLVRIVTPAGYATSTGTNGSATGAFEPGISDGTDNADHGSATAGGTISTATVTLTPGATNPDGLDNLRQDFGLIQPLSFGNTVFVDKNLNGTLDAGEVTLPGATVRLLNPDGSVVVSATTGADGKYQFTNLVAGSYIVELVPPTGYTLTPVTVDPTANTGNQNIGSQVGTSIRANVTLAPGGAPLIEGNTDGNNFVNGDFGLVAPPIAQVSGYVYRDPNLDGKYVRGTSPTGDTPIGVVTITLTDANGVVVATTKTNGDGFYQFTGLTPGTYTISETQPAGLLDGLDTPGTLGGSSPANDKLTVTLVANDDGQNYNFGEYQPTQVAGYVWVDANKNCTFDAGEATLANVPITISGTAFAGTSFSRPLTAADVPGGLTILTDASGHYSFPILPPGIYSVTRGALPAADAAVYFDWCEQIDDRRTPAPTATPNLFSNVSTTPEVTRGNLNFGVAPRSPVVPPTDPSKTDFLGSSGNTGGTGGTGGTNPNDVHDTTPGGPSSPLVQSSPTFSTSNTTRASAYTVIASGVGMAPLVRVMDYATGGEKFRITPYEASFTGGVRVAQGDVNGDGIDDIVTTTGVGGGPRTRVFDGATGLPIMDFFAFEPNFRGGTFVAVGDVNGDGKADIIVGAEVGGGPRITTFSGADGSVLNNFFAFDSTQRGGVRVAAGDFNGDGRADIVATTGMGVPTRVRVFDGTNVAATPIRDFAPYEASFTGGVNLAVGDFNGDGKPDIIVGAEAGGGPRAQVFSGLDLSVLYNSFAYESTFTGGVRVAAQDVNGDGKADLVTVPGSGGAARVRVINAVTGADIDSYYAFDSTFVGGAYVG
ncbi:SdrD B-like domain-containing protein [Limnoglobus roseus]|uniref:SdrD B-like domain-containing protein n=1 Tax=Limnoglobus roseus TaxID=2598579 RepID=UPI00143DC60E|nr:SdrD B-like domain-containing protein [Limnoglobus roseus]